MIVIQEYSYTLQRKTYYFPREFDSRFLSWLSKMICEYILSPVLFTAKYKDIVADAESAVDDTRKSRIIEAIELDRARLEEESNSRRSRGLVDTREEILFVGDEVTNERYAKDAPIADCLKYLTYSQFYKEFGSAPTYHSEVLL